MTLNSRLATLALLYIMSFLSLSVSAADLTATVDRTAVARNESFTYTLRYQGQAMSSPDFSALEKDFKVLSRQQQSQLSMGFGSGNQSTTDWVLSLMPKRTGTLTLPAISFKGDHSEQITIQVTEAPASDDKDQPIFVETELDTAETYVQGQVILTLRLSTSVMISSLNISDMMVANAQVIKINETQYQKLIGGRDHVVVEVKYALFPETPGTLDIPSVQINGVIPDRRDPFGGSSLFGSRGKSFHLESESRTINVKPVPDSVRNLSWMPAKGVSISQRWSDRSKSLTVGEPITRSITVTAQGLTGAQITPLNLQESGPFKFYPDQPDISESLSAAGVLGSRTESVAIVPTEAGDLTLPEVAVTWWDTTSNSQKTTRLDAVTLTVAPAPEAESPSVTNTSEQATEKDHSAEAMPKSPLLTASLIANGVLLMMLFILAATGRRRSRHPAAVPRNESNEATQEREAFARLERDQEIKASSFRQRILEWARLHWPDQRIVCLDDVSRLSGSTELKNLFAKLDESLYGNATNAVDTGAILAVLNDTRRHGHSGQSSTASNSTLKPLYPT
jgi:BatD DUF11 like domain